MNDEEVVLVMNFVEGASLECLLFSKKNAQEVCCYNYYDCYFLHNCMAFPTAIG